MLGALGFTGAKLSAAATGAAAMLFGLGVDGVVLLYVAHRLALADDADADVPAAIAGPSSSMLLGMWTTAATFYGLMFVDFPSLQQLGRADRPQHGGLRHPDARHGAGAAARAGRRGGRAALLMPRLAAGSSAGAARCSSPASSLTCVLGLRRDAASASTRRSIACDR